MSQHDKVHVQAVAQQNQTGWLVSITAPTFDTGDSILGRSTCVHKKNVARTARELATSILGVPEHRVRLTGVDYQ